MKAKCILVVSGDNLQWIKKKSLLTIVKQDVILGLEINHNNLNSSLYTSLSQITFPHVIIADFTNVSSEGLFEKISQAAGGILQLLLNTSYLRHFNKLILFLKTNNPSADNEAYLQKILIGYGLHNSRVINFSDSEKHETIQVFENAHALSLSGVNKYVNSEGIQQWFILYTSPQQFVSDYYLLSEKIEAYGDADTHVQNLVRSSNLLEENQQLKDLIKILNKNIHDLNNYYRYVRGETAFKHHNRDQQEITQAVSHVSDGIGFAGAFTSALSEKGKYIAYYTSVYEQTPWLFKKMATVIKIITGRRELSYYTSKKHKQAFQELINCLSEEKQVQVWYYYEYEVLPGWYKKMGRLLKRKALLPVTDK